MQAVNILSLPIEHWSTVAWLVQRSAWLNNYVVVCVQPTVYVNKSTTSHTVRLQLYMYIKYLVN